MEQTPSTTYSLDLYLHGESCFVQDLDLDEAEYVNTCLLNRSPLGLFLESQVGKRWVSLKLADLSLDQSLHSDPGTLALRVHPVRSKSPYGNVTLQIGPGLDPISIGVPKSFFLVGMVQGIEVTLVIRTTGPSPDDFPGAFIGTWVVSEGDSPGRVNIHVNRQIHLDLN